MVNWPVSYLRVDFLNKEFFIFRRRRTKIGVSGLIYRHGRIRMSNCDNWSVVGSSAPGNATLTGTPENALFTTGGSNWTVGGLTLAAGDEHIEPGPVSNKAIGIAYRS
jgi:hypothetical protein